MTSSKEPSPAAWWMLTPALLLYVVTFIVPFVGLIAMSFATFEKSVTTFGFSLENYAKFATDGVNVPIFLKTVKLSTLITLACLIFGYPVAAYMRNAGPRMRLLLLFLVVSPLLTSIIVRNVAWLLVLGRAGIINATLKGWGVIDKPLPLMYNDFGVIVGVVHVYLSFMILPIFASLVAIDRSTEEGAASLGASPMRVFWHVTWPLSLPGVIAGCTLVFILSMGVYLTPVIMGGSFVVTMPMVITDLARNQYNWPEASALALVLLAFIGLLIVISSRFQRARRVTT